MSCAHAPSRLLQRFRRSYTGNVAMVAAFVLPALALGVGASVELGYLLGDRSKMQDVADATALAAAQELALAGDDGLVERAKANALAQLGDIASRSTVTPSAEIVDDGEAVTIALAARRGSFFGNLLPPGGFNVSVSSTAVAMGRTPLCVLVNAVTPGDKSINLLDAAKVDAFGCLIHSNNDIVAESSSRIDAEMVQSVGAASGNINPEAEVGAEPIADPFLQTSLAPPGPCRDLPNVILTLGLHTLPAGRHCKSYDAKWLAGLKLAPGVHYFQNSELKVSERATLTGKNVVLIFDRNSKLTVTDTSTIDLSGREEGALAGFLIATTRDNTNDFLLWSNNVRRLLGVVYLPKSQLIVQGTDDIAEESAWTVIVADRVTLKGSPNLVINHDYSVGSVPVPNGVGNTLAEARLSR
jgi:Flp pilus assembly protein TadG